MASHSVIASMQKVPADVIQAIRNDKPIADEKLEALRTFAVSLIEKRGWLSEDDVAAFRSAGFSQAQVFEVVLAVSLKTLSNYASNLAETPLDNAFSSRAWQPLKKSAA
jgi:alkylhydroperoxidase family enzyme